MIEGERHPIGAIAWIVLESLCEQSRGLGVVLAYKSRLTKHRVTVADVSPDHVVCGIESRGLLVIGESVSVISVAEGHISEIAIGGLVGVTLDAALGGIYGFVVFAEFHVH